MSRFTLENETFHAAFGHDGHTGCFLQVWLQPLSEQDGCLLGIDTAYGVWETGIFLHDAAAQVPGFALAVNAVRRELGGEFGGTSAATALSAEQVCRVLRPLKLTTPDGTSLEVYVHSHLE